MFLRPILDRIVLKSVDLEEKTASGIILPTAVKEKPCVGQVIAIGDGNGNESIKLKEGDKVIYSKYSEVEVELDNQKYIILNYKDVLAVVED